MVVFASRLRGTMADLKKRQGLVVKVSLGRHYVCVTVEEWRIGNVNEGLEGFGSCGRVVVTSSFPQETDSETKDAQNTIMEPVGSTSGH